MNSIGKRVRGAVLAGLLATSMAGATPGRALVEEFEDDPFLDRGDGQPVFDVRGPREAFAYEPGTAPAFEGDAPGSLLARFDTRQPTARAFVPLPRPLGREDAFEASAIFVIRSAGFFADPSGFAQVSFGLMNLATTGDERTGSVEDPRADTFDTLEFNYFPNASFEGPFTGGAAFGGEAGGDAFLNFVFATVPVALPLDEPLDVRLAHRSPEGRVEIRVARILPDGGRQDLLAEPVSMGTAGLEPGFRLDALGVFAYHDGYNIFTESGLSLRADVDFHRLGVEFESPIPVRAEILPDPLFFSTLSPYVRARLEPERAADAGALADLAGEAPPIELWLGARLLAAALSAEYDPEEGKLVAVFDAAQVLSGVGSLRGEVELLVRGAVAGADRVFILGTASGAGGNPGQRKRRQSPTTF